MRFIFSCFRCTACLKFECTLQSVKTKKDQFFQICLLHTNYSFLYGFWFWPCHRHLKIEKKTPKKQCSFPSFWDLKWCLDKYCQHLLEFHHISSSSMMASEKDQAEATQCVGDLEKPQSSFLPNRCGVIFQMVASPLILAFAFIRIATVSLLSPEQKQKGLRKGMSAGRCDCTTTQCYHSDTVLSNIWRKSFCSILDCLLGCEAAVGGLTTWWAALKYTLRIKLFIQEWRHVSSLP